jgi:hypothetical protein
MSSRGRFLQRLGMNRLRASQRYKRRDYGRAEPYKGRLRGSGT